MTATRAQNAAEVARTAARVHAVIADLAGMQERLGLADRDDEYLYGTAMGALKKGRLYLRLLEARITPGEGRAS